MFAEPQAIVSAFFTGIQDDIVYNKDRLSSHLHSTHEYHTLDVPPQYLSNVTFSGQGQKCVLVIDLTKSEDIQWSSERLERSPMPWPQRHPLLLRWRPVHPPAHQEDASSYGCGSRRSSSPTKEALVQVF